MSTATPPSHLAPGMQEVLDQVAGWLEPTSEDPVATGREISERFTRWSRPPVAVERVEDHEVPRGGRSLRVRVYHPSAAPAAPALYIHGGAWSAGSIELADRFCRRLCRGSGRVVASVDYGLAPEQPYPAGLNDCTAALTWLDAQSEAIGSDGSAPALVGESAGANLAAALALRVRANGQLMIERQVLICPVLSNDFASDSHRRFGGGGFLVSSRDLADAWQMYLAGNQADDFAAPLLAKDLSGLPPTTIVVAGADPLYDDGKNFARRLSNAGNSVELIEAPRLLHGFIYMDEVSGAAAAMVDQICELISTDTRSEA